VLFYNVLRMQFFLIWCNFMLFFAPRFVVFFTFLAIKKAAILYCRYKVLIYCCLIIAVVVIVAAGRRAAGACSAAVVVGFQYFRDIYNICFLC